MDTIDMWSSEGSVREESGQVQNAPWQASSGSSFPGRWSGTLYISKDRLKGEGKKLKPIRYDPFKIVEDIGNNDFQIDLTPYMHIYLVVNVENMKLYEPPMIIDPEEDTKIPKVDDFSPEYMNEFQEDTILDRNVHTSRSEDVEYLRVGLKGMNPSKAGLDLIF